MKEYTPVKEGKVRELYDADDSLIMVATDRISAFDHILQNDIVDKGVVLTQMSKFWFDFTSDVVPNHMISTDVNDMPEFFRNEKFEGRSMMCRKLEMLPLECIVRGYITGSGWASYQETGEVCGIKLPEGLQESQQLPEPIFTPSTKAEIGDHDENISYEKSIEVQREIIRDTAKSTLPKFGISPFPYIRSVRTTHGNTASSSPTPSSSSDWTRTARSFWQTKC